MDINAFKDYLTRIVEGMSFTTQPGLQQRGIGDLCEAEIIDKLLKSDVYSFFPARSNRSMEDISAKLGDYNIYIDIKSGDVNKSFSMPNLTSIDRLKDFYADSHNYFVLLFVKYSTSNSTVDIENVRCLCVEDIAFDSFNFGNIGKGQLQLNDSICIYDESRDKWLLEFYDKGVSHYIKVVEDAISRRDKWIELKTINTIAR